MTARGPRTKNQISPSLPRLLCFQKISCSERTQVKCPALNRLSIFLGYPPWGLSLLGSHRATSQPMRSLMFPRGAWFVFQGHRSRVHPGSTPLHDAKCNVYTFRRRARAGVQACGVTDDLPTYRLENAITRLVLRMITTFHSCSLWSTVAKTFFSVWSDSLPALRYWL